MQAFVGGDLLVIRTGNDVVLAQSRGNGRGVIAVINIDNDNAIGVHRQSERHTADVHRAAHLLRGYRHDRTQQHCRKRHTNISDHLLHYSHNLYLFTQSISLMICSVDSI